MRARISLVSRCHPLAEVLEISQLLLFRCPRGVLCAEKVLSALKLALATPSLTSPLSSIMRGAIGEIILFDVPTLLI